MVECEGEDYVASYLSCVEGSVEAPKLYGMVSVEEAVEVGKLLCGKDDVLLAFGSLSFQGKLISMFQKGKQQKGN